MTVDDTVTSGQHYYLPLTKRGVHYVAAPARWDESLIEMEDLLEEVEAHYHAVDAVVSIDGMFYATKVYISGTEEHTAYVVVTSDRRPVTRQTAADIRTDDIAAYLKTVNDCVEQTDSYPTQCGEYIRHVFIDPYVAEIDTLQTRRSTSRLLWGDVACQ